MTNIVDKIRRSIPLAGNPESDLTAEDFEDFDPSGSGDGDSEEEESEGEGDSDERGDGDSEEEESEGEGDSDERGDNSNNLDNEKREDIKRQMEQSSSERDMSDWFDTNEDEDSSRFLKRQFEQLQEARSEPETQIGQRKKNRDERIESMEENISCPHSEVLDKYEDRFADEISEAFRKIKTRSTPEPSEHGMRVNMRGVVRRRSGDTAEERLYLEMDPSEVGDRCITVVVDSSGSMDELEVKLALYALSDATDQIGDHFAATTYDTKDSNMFGVNSKDPRTHLITGPNENFKPEHLDTFRANGLTPTATGISDGRSIADITPNSEDVIIVITDGVANVTLEGRVCDDKNLNNRAMKEASNQVNSAINNGKRVIGVGVGEYLSDEAMEKVFGNNYVKTEMEDMSDALVDIYREQMKTDAS